MLKQIYCATWIGINLNFSIDYYNTYSFANIVLRIFLPTLSTMRRILQSCFIMDTQSLSGYPETYDTLYDPGYWERSASCEAELRRTEHARRFCSLQRRLSTLIWMTGRRCNVVEANLQPQVQILRGRLGIWHTNKCADLKWLPGTCSTLLTAGQKSVVKSFLQIAPPSSGLNNCDRMLMPRGNWNLVTRGCDMDVGIPCELWNKG